MTRTRLLKCYTASEIAERLAVTLLTVYKWKNHHGAPWRILKDDKKSAQYIAFEHTEFTEWLREHRPELMFLWNGKECAELTKKHAWTRRRLREQVYAQHMA